MRALVCTFSQQLENKRKPTNEITFHGKFVTQKYTKINVVCAIFPLYVYQTPEVEMMMIHREKWFRLE